MAKTLDLTEFGGAPQLDLSEFQSPPKKSSTLRKAADIPLGIASGAIVATRALSDAFGADNAVSQGLRSAGEGVDSLLTPEAKAAQARQAGILAGAEDKGFIEQVGAGARAFMEAPLQTTAHGAGSVVPFLATATIPGVVPARIAAVTMGAGMGAGTVKGAISEEIKERETGAGKTPEEAAATAKAAQAYGGENMDQIAIGAGLGIADAAFGVAPAAVGLLRKTLGKEAIEQAGNAGEGILKAAGKGMVKEMPVEFAQGWQEQVAANVAAQRAGYEAGTFDGAFSQGTLEALASAGPGAGFGVLNRQRPDAPLPNPLIPPDATPPAPPNNTIDFEPGLVPGIDVGQAQTPTIPAGEMQGIDFERVQADPPPANPLLPAPTPSGLTSGQVDALGEAQQAEIAAAQANADALYAERARIEAEKRNQIIPVVGPLSAAASAAVQTGAVPSVIMAGLSSEVMNAPKLEQMAQEAAQAGNAQANAVQIAAQIEAAQSVNDLQQTLRGIESDELVSTLVQYPALTDKVMGAMSPGARQMLSDDLAKVADVEQAAAPQGEVAASQLSQGIESQPAAAFKQGDKAMVANDLGSDIDGQEVEVIKVRGEEAVVRFGNDKYDMPISELRTTTGQAGGDPVVDAAPVQQPTAPARSLSDDADIAKGAAGIAQRQANAANKFVDSVQEQFGLSREDAGKAWNHFVKNKLVKIDLVGGQYSLADGRLWDGDVMRQAASSPLSSQQKPIPAKSRKATASGNILNDLKALGADPMMIRRISTDGVRATESIRDLGEMAERLRSSEFGYTFEDVNNDPAQGLAEFLRRVASGEASPLNASRLEAEMDARNEYMHKQDIKQKAKKYGIKTVARKFNQIEADVLAVLEQRHNEAVAKLDARAKARFDAMLERATREMDYDTLDSVITDAQNRYRGRQFWNEAAKNIRNYLDQLAIERQINGQQTNEITEDATPGQEPDWLTDGRGTEGTGSGSIADRGNQAQEPGSGQTGSRTEAEADFSLAPQTEEEVRAQEEARKESDSDAITKEQADRERDAVPFSLAGQSQPKPQGVQTGMFTADGRVSQDAKPATANPPVEQKPVSANTIFTEDAAAAARARLKAKLGRLNSGLDPEMMMDGITLAGYNIEKGARTFAAYAKAMVEDLGDGVKPYLQSWYMAVRADPRAAGFKADMDKASVVEDLDVDAVLEAKPKQSPTVEMDQAKASTLTESLYQAIQANQMPKGNPALKKLVEAFDGKPADQARMKQAQEELETAIAMRARELVAKNEGDRTTFDTLLRLYESQPNLNIRTSTSVANQAYSTPAPLAWLASRLAGVAKSSVVHEPTGGTGMLLIAADPAKSIVNELNDLRIDALKAQGFKPTQKDAATQQLVPDGVTPTAVVTNPPFGSIKDSNGNTVKVKVDGFSLGQIDHLIAARALNTMSDDGRATLIIGANKVAGGLSTDDRIFFNWLYSHYNVVGHFELDGGLYSRQGAGWPVRVITVNGRQKSNKASPVAGTIQRVDNWSAVYEQFTQSLASANSKADTLKPSAIVGDGTRPSRPVAAPPKASESKPKGSAGSDGNVARTPPGDVSDSAKPADKPVGGIADEQRLNAQSFVPQPQPGQSPVGAAGPAKPTRAAAVEAKGNEFQSPYTPRSARKDEGVLIPANMAQPTQDALSRLEDEVGDIDEFARKELGYATVADLHDALMGLQVDSVAMSIHQIKQGKAVVIADQTGIGKGRQAASIIRWAALNGYTPVFVSVKPSLFTDMYGDLADIGTNDVAPFIMNSDAWISGDGNAKLFANKPGLHKRAIQGIADTGRLPEGRNALFMTYSQINVANVQRQALMALASNAVFVLDESHNAAGASATGEFVISALDAAKGVTYLSATYAKRPDNMPLYFKTDIGDAAADTDGLATAMSSGGLPLQTVVSNNLVKAGQMFRRERSYDGVSIASVFDAPNRALHERMSDEATKALRAIVSADRAFHSIYVKNLAKALEKSGETVIDNAGNRIEKSVQHTEFSSVVHNFVKQMLLGLKAQSAADEAIASLRRGEKPIIAVENTMGSFLNEYASANGISQGGSLGSFDYRTVLSRALERSRVIVEVGANGDKVKRQVSKGELDPITLAEYEAAQEVIDGLRLDIPVSPIDWMRAEIIRAGFSVAEITGRNLSVDYSDKKNPVLSAIDATEQSDKVATTKRFNAGNLDALILNVAGSTGISLHASEKFADQSQRHMIVAQAAGDINIFMQMLGRIHRTGQVRLPKYTILSVDLPTEKRPTAVLSIKMKSLNANTSSNTESATSVKSLDILNKYGDQIVNQYLLDNISLADALDITQDLGDDPMDDIARKATGRLALQPIEVQTSFYEEVESQYEALIDYLNKTNQNDLEPRTFDFDAREIRQEVLFDGPNKGTPFGDDAIYGEYSIKAQGEPMKPAEIKAVIAENLGGKTGAEHASNLINGLLKTYADQMNADRAKAGLVPGAFDEAKYFAHVKGMFGEDRAAWWVDKAKAAIASGKQVEDVTPEMMANTLGSAAGIEFIRTHHIGRTFRVDINSEPFNAVITGIRSTHKSAGNPFSLSKIQVTVAVNGALRSLSIPATQFKKIEVSSIQPGFQIDQLFKEQPPNQRETAKIITGNLLAAYGELQGVRGTIITFTKQDGTSEQGILLPKLFNYTKNTRGDYRLPDGAAALKFLQRSDNKDIGRFGIMTRDGIVRVLPSGRGIRVQVPGSKLRGGKYFLDKNLIAVSGDFVTQGQSMTATVENPAEAVKMLDLLMKKQALYALPSMAEEAKAITGDKQAGNIATGSLSAADKAIYSMAAEGKSAAEVLKFIASASRSPFNRQVAKLLLKTGINPSITVGDSKGWKFNAGEGNKYAAGYDPKSNTVALFRPASAERNMLHEMIHAATLKALSKKGMAAGQMKALFAHVEKIGKLKGMYGMSNVDEFIAEAFTNPKFQELLKSVSAPVGGNKLSTAWEWFVRVVRGILGLPSNRDSALSKAIEIGLGVMQENMKATEVKGGTRYNASESPSFDVDRAWRELVSRMKFSDFDEQGDFEVTRNDDAAIGFGAVRPPRSFVLSKQGGKEWASLSVEETTLDDGSKAMTASLEASADFPKGTGIATKMYLSALNVAQKNKSGWISEGIRSDESLAIYRRLKDAGIPFTKQGGASFIGATDLANVDMQAVADRLDAGRIRYNIAEDAIGAIGKGADRARDAINAMAGRNDDRAAGMADLNDDQRALLRKIGASRTPAADAIKAATARAGLKIRQGVLDRYAALKELDQQTLGENFLDTAITDSSWVLAKMSSAAGGALNSMMNTGRIKYNADQKVIEMRWGADGGLIEVLKKLGPPAEVERFFAWVAANRSNRLQGEGRENLFTPDEIAAGMALNAGSTESGESRSALYATTFNQFQKYRDDVLSIAEASGIVSAENRAMWRDEFYVPFYRIMDDDNAAGPGGSKGLSRQEAFKRLKGGKQNLNDLMENTLMNFHHLLSASLKNQAAMQAITNAEQAGLAHEVPESRRDTKTSTFVMKEGKKVFYQVDDPLVFEAITTLSDPGLNSTAVKMMAAFKRAFTQLTTITPQFIIANAFRDLLQASATSPTSKNIGKNLVQGVKNYRDDKVRAEMLASGGAFSFGHIYGMDAEEVKASLRKTVVGAELITHPTMIPNILRKGWRAWDNVIDTSENISRAATYVQNVDQLGKLRAAFESRDVMDFSQHGAWPAVRFLIRVVPFLNARLQGLDKLYRSGVKPSVLTAMGKGSDTDKQAAARFATVTGALTVATMALFMANADDEEYQKLEEWQKDTYWFFRIGSNAYFLPKPFEVGAIATLAERTLQQAMDDKATGKLFADRFKDMLMQTFAFNPVPQMFQPMMDIYSNRDAFTGRDIESFGMERLSTGLRARDTTTAPARAISAASRVLGEESPVAISPVQADHLIKGYLGSVGASGAGWIDTMYRAATGQESPDKRLVEYQPIRRFYRDLETPVSNTRYSTLFYDGLREANRIYSDVRELQKLGRFDEAEFMIGEKKNMLRIRASLNSSQRRLSEINNRLKEVRRSDNDGEWKRREIDLLNTQRSLITERMGKLVEMQRVS